MRVLVWQWGRRGGGPRYGVELAAALGTVPGVTTLLSLSRQAEILHGPEAPDCALPVTTYGSLPGFVLRCLLAPFQVGGLAARLRALRPDVAICGMPGPLDLLMAEALRRAGIPFLVVVHDADLHPGDGLPLQMTLQRWLMRRAAGLIALSAHVADRLRAQTPGDSRPLIVSRHPPRDFGPPSSPALAHGGPMRLLSFGRLLPYKGLDLLEAALRLLGDRADWELRIVGSGPGSPVLDRLRALPHVTVENRWVPEGEIGSLLAWSDAMVLSHTEASQSGGAAAALAAGRFVVATRVGGLAEQLADQPQARLCPPDAASLAATLAGLLDERPAAPVSTSSAPAWQAMAGDLIVELRVAVGGK